jgi:hypothetical protein
VLYRASLSPLARYAFGLSVWYVYWYGLAHDWYRGSLHAGRHTESFLFEEGSPNGSRDSLVEGIRRCAYARKVRCSAVFGITDPILFIVFLVGGTLDVCFAIVAKQMHHDASDELCSLHAVLGPIPSANNVRAVVGVATRAVSMYISRYRYST